MKFREIHTVYHFRLVPRLSKYTKYKAHQRAEAKTELEKVFFHILMINAFYGKLKGNPEERVNLDLINKTDTQRITNSQSNERFFSKTGEYEKCKLFPLTRKISNFQTY